MIESRASNITLDKGNKVCCHNGSTNKDLRRICGSQYEHPGSAIGYWPERCLGHVNIVLEPVGSTHLTFDDDFVLYELCDLVTECCLESLMRSRTWGGVSKWSIGKDWYIWRWYLDTESIPGVPGTPSADPICTRYPPKHFRCPNTIVLYINLYLSTILRLLDMSLISSGTPNNIRSPNHLTRVI